MARELQEILDSGEVNDLLMDAGYDPRDGGTDAQVATKGYVDRTVTEVDAATYDLLVTDDILHVTYTTTGAVTSITWPTAQITANRVVVIKDGGLNAGTNNITIDTEGSETIDGENTAVLTSDGESISIYCDGSNLFIF